MGENIGAVARAMSNFSLQHLRIVNPRDGWPNSKAQAMAAHGDFVLNKARIYSNLKEAIADTNLVFSTVGNHRDMPQKTIFSHEIVELCSNYGAKSPSMTIAFLFGRESNGLSNEEIALSDYIINIATSPCNPSINLGVAAAIIAYEIAKIFFSSVISQSNNRQQPAIVKQDITVLTRRFCNRVILNNAIDQTKLALLPQKLHRILSKASLTRAEVKLLHWLLRNI